MIKYVIEYVIFFLGFCKVRQLFRYKQIKIATFAFYFQQITFSDFSTPQYSIYGASRSMSCFVKSLSNASCDKLVMGP